MASHRKLKTGMTRVTPTPQSMTVTHGPRHLGTPCYTRLYLETGPDADARRQRALPLVAQNPTRQPDTIFSGPDVPLDEEVRRRFFAED